MNQNLLPFAPQESREQLLGFFVFSILPAAPVSQETVYGRREGCITGLAVFHRDRGNIFRTSAGIKSAVIHDVKMLPRHAMWKPTALWLRFLMSQGGGSKIVFVVYKPLFSDFSISKDYTCDLCLQASPKKQNLPHLGRAMTDQQEQKQAPELNFLLCTPFFPQNTGCHKKSKVKTQSCQNKVAGGTDFVRATLKALLPASVQTCMVLDLVSYDGWAALAALEDFWAGWLQVIQVGDNP